MTVTTFRGRRRQQAPGQSDVPIHTAHRGLRRRNLTGWLFILPLVAGIAAFQLVPVLISVYASLTDWDGITSPGFVGMDNYVALTGDPFFWQTLKNTAVFTCGVIPLTLVVALFLAILCNRKGIRGKAFFRTAYFTPFITSMVAISLVWTQFYAPRGVLNGLLDAVGVSGPSWLASSTWALPAVIIVAVWQGVGYPMVILLAGLQGIPGSLYEAARLDGANAWRQFTHVTIPMLTPQIFFVLITQFVTSFQVFAIIYVMTRGGPGNATNVYIYYLYQNAFTYGRLGYASAMAWILFVLIAVLTAIQWRLQKRWVFYE